MAFPTPKPVDLALTVPTLIGSVLSCLGSGFMLICYSILPIKQHFRHALIINLAVSDFLNSLGFSISGIYILSSGHDLSDGPACVASGFWGQLSVQGTDCSIFIIAIVTLFSLTRQKMVIRDTSLLAKIVVCGAAWVLPIITSFTALGLNLYHPVSGNWCWIQAKPIYLRYLLTHMWRFLFIILSTAIYIYIYIWVNRHFKAMRLLGSPNDGSDATDAELGRKHRPVNLVPEDGTKSATLVASTNHHPKPSPSSRDGVVINQSFTLNESYVKERSPNPAPPVPITGATDTETYIKRTLLLNAYPIMYILLWIPGIANRLAEASGHPSRALAIMQASTQYIGLANAVTYGLNERVLGQLKTLFLGD